MQNNIDRKNKEACPAKLQRSTGFSHQNFLKKISGGFTIIETMVSVSLFLVIVMAGMGSLLNASLLHHKSADMRSIMDNLSFVMEDMSRNLRTGYDYIYSSNLGEIRISFVHQNEDPNDNAKRWVYSINHNTKVIQRSTDNGTSWVTLTPNEVKIDSTSSFTVTQGPNIQPRVTIILSGKIITKDFETPFSLRTSVSQRKLNR